MSEKLGPIAFGKDNDEVFIGKDYNHVRNYSESVACQIDEEVEAIVCNAYKRTEEILRTHIDKLHIIAKALVAREKLTGEEFYLLMDGKELPPVSAPAEPQSAQAETQDTESDGQPARTAETPLADGTPADTANDADTADAPQTQTDAAEPPSTTNQ